MKTSTITQELTRAINGRTVLSAVFTTYSFEPDFFELEILPSLMSKDYAYSPSGIFRRIQLEQQLLEEGLAIDIYYDSRVFNREASPLLEYRCFGVDISPFAFHAKLIILLTRDEETGRESLILGAGSNNISEAGWLSSIECCHFTEIDDHRAPSSILLPLRTAVAYVAALRVGVSSAATDAIALYLSNLIATDDEPQEIFYFQTGQRENGNFLSFLAGAIQGCSSVDIVSPFFPDSETSNLHLTVNDTLKSDTCRIYLPCDPHLDGTPALTTRAFYEHIKSQHGHGVSWACWNEIITKALGEQQPRRLHAKLFLLHAKDHTWIFSGSVNFSNCAFYNNVEAGFLVLEPSRENLLKSLDHEPVQFVEKQEAAPGEQADLVSKKLLFFSSYDWQRKELSLASSEDCDAELLDESERPFVGPVPLTPNCTALLTLTGNPLSKLEKLLGNSSLLQVQLSFGASEEKDKRWIIVQQINTFCRPSRLPSYSVMEILSLYCSPTVERRMGKIEELAARAGFEILLDADETSTLPPETPASADMFSEFSQIHAAFRQIRKRIDTARQRNMLAQVDYFLTGKRPDSIPGLLNALDESTNMSGVTDYLILLSCMEIITSNMDRPGVDKIKAELLSRIDRIKGSGRIAIGSIDREKFFEWYEQEFFRSVAQPMSSTVCMSQEAGNA